MRRVGMILVEFFDRKDPTTPCLVLDNGGPGGAARVVSHRLDCQAFADEVLDDRVIFAGRTVTRETPDEWLRSLPSMYNGVALRARVTDSPEQLTWEGQEEGR